MLALLTRDSDREYRKRREREQSICIVICQLIQDSLQSLTNINVIFVNVSFPSARVRYICMLSFQLQRETTCLNFWWCFTYFCCLLLLHCRTTDCPLNALPNPF